MTTYSEVPLFGTAPRRSRSKSPDDPRIIPLVQEAQAIVEAPFLNWGKQTSAAKRLLKAQYDEAVILDCLRYCVKDEWYIERCVAVDLGIVSQRIGAWVKAGKPERHNASRAERAKKFTDEYWNADWVDSMKSEAVR